MSEKKNEANPHNANHDVNEIGAYHFERVERPEQSNDVLHVWIDRKRAIGLIRELATYLSWDDEDETSMTFAGKIEWIAEEESGDD